MVPDGATAEAGAFARTHAEAEARANKYFDKDPLRAVPPALLNSVDVIEYIRLTGMVHPFDAAEPEIKKRFKTSSFEVPLLGEMYWTDEKQNYQWTCLTNLPRTIK